MSYITLDQIDKYYGKNQVLKGIRLEIKQGELVTLLGSSGCGKSTLLRCLAGLEEIQSGRISLDGEDITNKDPKDRNVGMIFQQYSLFPNFNVEDNIAFGLKVKKKNPEEIRRKVDRAIRLVELEGKEKQFPSKLSGGQQQRVALARAIVTEPKVLLLDEPFSAVDAKLRRSLQSRILEIHKELGLTSIFVTHDQDEAMILSDVIHLMHQGTIEQSGKPMDLYTAPKSHFAAGFIGHYNILPREHFHRLTGEDRIGAKDVIVRPETVELSSKPFGESDTEYRFTAVIRSHTLRGNVLRYSIEAQNTILNADAIFRSFHLFQDGSEVHVSIAKHNCLSL